MAAYPNNVVAGELGAGLKVLERIRVVLVEPSHPGNIGGAARALKVMGLSDLAVVNPQRFPDPQAEWRAAGAQDVLTSTTVHETLDEAIADCHWVVGASTRQRRIPWPLMSAEEIAREAINRQSSAPNNRIAILFGREANGLTNDELQKCHCHLRIPAHPDYPSLNLAMAVQVVSYELFKQASGGQPVADVWDRAPATAEQVEGLMTHLENVLISIGFLDPANPGQSLTRLRRLFNRIQPDETEVQMLRGVLNHLGKGNSGPN
ncbi:MAG: RNA methyltransferase [Gammaproteobacteria bacterium]|nr:RNA methyltransferase [Gammaproteobacteria bacterium]MCZ6853646.1 RNA methyltransferase [Gammaproteobacteria bacterium]